MRERGREREIERESVTMPQFSKLTDPAYRQKVKGLAALNQTA